MYRVLVDLLKRNFIARLLSSAPAARGRSRSPSMLAALSFCVVALATMSPAARAQSVYFNPSTLAGTIGTNRISGTLNECPNDQVLVGVRVEDRQNVAPNGAWGILVRLDLRCGTISVSPAGAVVVTQDPGYVAFTTYDQGDGGLDVATCPAGQVVTQMGGDTFNTTGPAWASTIRIYCRPLMLTAAGQIRVNTGVAATQLTAGGDENNVGSSFAGPFCGANNAQMVRGYRPQYGGEGLDGVNVSCATLASDYGDAPASYGAASHEIDAAVYLGATADGEAASQSNATATGDDVVGGAAPNLSVDDEDGVAAFPTLTANASSYSVNVTATNHLPGTAATLAGWIDFNRNGTFEAAEGATASVPAGTTSGTFTLTWNGVSGLTTTAGGTYARFRLSSAAISASTPTGAVANGEVEDHALTIQPGLVLNKTTQIRAGGPFDFTLTNTGQTTGTATTTAVDTAVQVDGDTSTTGTQTYVITSATTAVTIDESSIPVGWQVATATCVNAASTTVGSLTGNVYTITAAEVAASKSFSCTFTNRPVSSTLQLAKTWTNGRTGDVASIGATTGGTNNTAGFTATAPNVADSGAAVTVYAGEVVTLPAETMTTGALANYATTLTCTGVTPSGTDGQATNTLTVPNTSSTIVCTYDNSRRSATLQLAKTWLNAVSGDVARIGATTGGTNNTTLFTATAPNAADSGPAATVYAGDTLALPAETMSTGTLAHYTTTVACTGGTLSGTNGQAAGNTLAVRAADAGAAIVCTYANAHNPLIEVAKTVNASTPNPIEADQDAVFDLTVTNTATGTTQPAGYQFLEVVPQHTTFTAISGGTTDCALPAAAGTLCTMTVTAPVVAGTPQVVAVTMRTVDPLPRGVTQLFNLATQDTTPPAGCATPGQVCVTPPTVCATPNTCATVPLRVVNLAIDKTATPSGTYLPGQALDYTIVVTNNGLSAASGIGVTDTVPANVTVSGWTCTTSGTGNDCDTTAAGTGATGTTNAISLANVSLEPGASLTITIDGTAALAATGAIVNTATATPPTGATCTAPPCTVSDTATNTDGGTPQLTLVKTATPAAFAVGQPATYTLAVSNTGTSSTSGTISVSDPLPAGITAVLPVTATGWDCSASTTLQVNCSTNAVLLPGSNAPVINVTVAVAPTTANPAVNTATVQGGGDASCPAATDYCASTTSTPVNAPRLDVVKSLSGNLVVGVTATYTIQVTNNGTADTLAGTIADTIPAGLTIGAVSAGCTVAGQVVTCNIPAGLSAGESISFTTEVTPQASVSGQAVTNNAVASGGGDPTCPQAAHCTGTTTDAVDAPQLSLVKTATPDPFVVGVPATYTLTLTNTGTAATTAVTTVSDTIPGGLTIGTLPTGCTVSGQVVTCTVTAPLATNTPVAFAIPVTPQASLNGLSVTNNATATGGGDPSCAAGADATTLPARCIGRTTTNVNAPKLDIVKSASGANFVIGVAASYTLQVTNSGLVPTTGDATVTDVIPADLVIDSAPGCTIAGQTVTCTIASLAAGATTSFTINVTPTAAASGQTLTNTATVQGGGDPTCPTESHCQSTTNTPVDAPQLTVRKVPSAPTFVVGVPASYTLRVTNTGSAATTMPATVTDNVPSTLMLGTPPAGCTAAGQAVTCAIPAALAVGASVSFVIPVTATSAANGTIAVNGATTQGGGDPTCPADGTHCGSTANTPVDAPQLTIRKAASATAFVVGQPASYTLRVTNTGSAATTADATVTDTVPASLTLGAMPAGCSAAGQVVTCTIATGFAIGANASFVIPVTPNAAANGTTIVNTATVQGGGDDTCPADATHCSSTTNTPVDAPQLTIRKTASATSFVVGVPASYTLTVANAGSAATTAAATVSDTVPASLALGAMPAGCVANGQVVTCTIPAGLAVGARASFVIPVTPTAAASGTTVANTATVSGGGDPACPAAANCTSTTNTPVDAPQLTLTKTASATSFVVGVPSSYTLTATNTGTAATTAEATIGDTVPASLMLGTMPAGCAASGQVVTCTIPTGLAIGASASFVIPVTPTPAANGTTVTNTATVSGGGTQCPAAANCTSTTDTPVNAPQLTLVKTTSGPSFVVGVPSSYTLRVTNTGTAATTAAATIGDTVPASLTLGAMPAGCTASGQVVTCTIPAGLAIGASASFVIPVTPTPAANGTTVTNTATVSGGGTQCPAAANCTSTTDTPVNAPQLTLTKTASTPNFVVGVPASYTLRVTNTGTAATTQPATVGDTVPASLALGTMPAGCSSSGQVVTCTIPAGLAVGASASFVIPVTPTPAANGTTVANTATVTGTPECPAAANCTSTTNTPVNAPQLTLVKTASAPNFVVNVPASYTLRVTNTGTAATTAAATIGDTVPASLTLGAMPAGCVANGQVVTCTIAAGLAPNASVAFVIPVTPTPAASGTTVTNTATVAGGGTQCPAAANCTSTTNTPVDTPRLTIVKTASAANFTVGVPASYTLTVTNTGSVATTAEAKISDPVPASLTVGSPMPAGCTLAASTVTCTIAAGLAPNANVAFVIPVTPTATASGTTVSNTATVGGGGDPVCPLPMRLAGKGGPVDPNCSATVDVPVDAPMLTLVKTASAPNFTVGVPASYTLTVTNTGSAATTQATTVEDPLPAGLEPGTLPAGCAIAGQVVTCTIPAGLAPNASAAFVIPVTPTAAATGTISNTATITSGDPTCPQAAHCAGTVDVPVGAIADLVLAKSDGGTTAAPGRPITWTLTATNNGPGDAANVVVTDPLPAGLTYVGATGDGWTCATTGGSVSCTRPALANGAVATIALTLSVPAAYGGPNPIVNTATVASDTPDPDPRNNTGTDGTPMVRREMPVPAMGPPALLGMILMLGGFALVAQAARRRSPQRR